MNVPNTLDRWFPVGTPSIPIYFYMDWSQPTEPAEWLDELPAKVNYQLQINWRDLKRTQITVCGYFPPNNETKKVGNNENDEKNKDDGMDVECNGFQLGEEKKYNNVSFLKSHLQKCIRRQALEPALKTTHHLLKMDPVELLRRLPIIMIEDVLLHESISTLVWLMVVVSHPVGHFKWEIVHVDCILSIVRLLCLSKYFDNHKPPEDSRFVFGQNLSKLKKNLTNRDRGTLYSLQLRKAYGGMKGDMALIDNHTHQWYLRLTQKKTGYLKLLHQPLELFGFQRQKTDGTRGASATSGSNVNVNDLLPKPLKLREWILAGIDFHCASYMLDWLQQKYPDYKRAELQEAIWCKRSSLNTRTYLGKKPVVKHEVSRLWQKIRWQVENNSAYILLHYH